jgi:indole-3-glycerol phosphate synthase
MNILERITETKRTELTATRMLIPEEQLMKYPVFHKECNSLKKNLQIEKSPGIIAEFKRRSPSKGDIHPGANVVTITRGYSKAGAVALSVLTDSFYFGGSCFDLVNARLTNPDIPILRKDFIIDPYQITETKALGADVILLIAACLSREEIHQFTLKAKALGLEVLLEIHGKEELEKISTLVDFVGINNRDLKTFAVNIETSLCLASVIPENFIKISESGISSPETIIRLKKAGYAGFLIGEHFMNTGNPPEACKKMVEQIHYLEDITMEHNS